MSSILKLPVNLVTKDNINQWLIEPPHPAVEFLSDVHKSDYYRIYFLYHYGGAYTDVKPMVRRWDNQFIFFLNPKVWVLGVPEIPNGQGVKPGKSYPKDFYKRMVSNGFYIARPETELFKQIHDEQHKILDERFEDLKNHPPPFSRCCMHGEGGYPLRWTELLGELQTDAVDKYNSHVLQTLEMPDLSNYM